SEVKLTRGADHVPRFTPDGGSILFARQRGAGQSLWRVPVLGGAPRLVLEDATDADPSPNGDQIAYVSASTDSAGVHGHLMVAKSDGTGGRELWASPGSTLFGSPRWSPDARRISLILNGSQNTPNAVVVVDVSSGSARVYPAPTGAVLSNAAWDGS